MGLIDFLEGAYKGGRLLFLLYDHEKQVKLRYKSIKGSGIKRLPNPSGAIVSESIKHVQKQALVNQQYNQYMRGFGDISSLARTVNSIPKPKIESALEDEIKSSLAQGFEVTIHNGYMKVRCLRTRFFEWMYRTDHISEGTKLSMINKMKHSLIERRCYISRPIPSKLELRQRNMELNM